MRAVKITPVESLMLRGPGEFDPSARGVTVAAQSAAWPSPGTIAGMLLALTTQARLPKVGNWSDFLKNYGRLVEESLDWIRGPYLVDKKGEIYVPLWIGESLLVKWEAVRRPEFKKLVEQLRERKHEALKTLETLCLQHDSMRAIQQERVGISLRGREGVKTVREGYLYIASFAYLPGSFVVEVGAIQPASHVAAFGGEGRVARVEVGDGGWIVENIYGGGGYALLLSPMPFLSKVGKDGEICETMRLVAGRVAARGLGYAITEGVRKPIYPTISEGSVVDIDCSGVKKEEILKYGAYACTRCDSLKTLGLLGFGSFVML